MASPETHMHSAHPAVGFGQPGPVEFGLVPDHLHNLQLK